MRLQADGDWDWTHLEGCLFSRTLTGGENWNIYILASPLPFGLPTRAAGFEE